MWTYVEIVNRPAKQGDPGGVHDGREFGGSPRIAQPEAPTTSSNLTSTVVAA
jgi:hypothetical protein